MKEFKTKESYKHYYAKHLLHKWLCQHEERWVYKYHEIGRPDTVKYSPISWEADDSNIFRELPFYERCTPFYFSELFPCENETGDIRIASTETHGKILFVPDITIVTQDRASILIEVVHKSPVSDYKLNTIKRFFNNDVELYEVQAEWILSQIEKPKYLRLKKLLGRTTNAGRPKEQFFWEDESLIEYED